MNDDDRFLERLRSHAKTLRYEPVHDVLWNRLETRVRDRIRTMRVAPTVTDLLAGWMRPVAASLVVLAIAGSVAVGVESHYRERAPSTLDALSQPPSDISTMVEDLLSAGD